MEHLAAPAAVSTRTDRTEVEASGSQASQAMRPCFEICRDLLPLSRNKLKQWQGSGKHSLQTNRLARQNRRPKPQRPKCHEPPSRMRSRRKEPEPSSKDPSFEPAAMLQAERTVDPEKWRPGTVTLVPDPSKPIGHSPAQPCNCGVTRRRRVRETSLWPDDGEAGTCLRTARRTTNRSSTPQIW